MQVDNHVGGKWVPAAGGGSDAVINPATGAEIGRAASSDTADVDAAVEAAVEAFEVWSTTTPKARSEALNNLATRLEDDVDELARLESLNVGKPVAMIGEELALSFDNLRFFAAGARFLD